MVRLRPSGEVGTARSISCHGGKRWITDPEMLSGQYGHGTRSYRVRPGEEDSQTGVIPGWNGHPTTVSFRGSAGIWWRAYPYGRLEEDSTRPRFR